MIIYITSNFSKYKYNLLNESKINIQFNINLIFLIKHIKIIQKIKFSFSFFAKEIK